MNVRRAIQKMEEAHIERADREAMYAWREFVEKFRAGRFDAEVRIGDRRYLYADRDAIDQFIRR